MTVQAASVDKLLDSWARAQQTIVSVRTLAQEALLRDKRDELAAFMLLLTEEDGL